MVALQPLPVIPSEEIVPSSSKAASSCTPHLVERGNRGKIFINLWMTFGLGPPRAHLYQVQDASKIQRRRVMEPKIQELTQQQNTQ